MRVASMRKGLAGVRDAHFVPGAVAKGSTTVISVSCIVCCIVRVASSRAAIYSVKYYCIRSWPRARANALIKVYFTLKNYALVSCVLRLNGSWLWLNEKRGVPLQFRSHLSSPVHLA